MRAGRQHKFTAGGLRGSSHSDIFDENKGLSSIKGKWGRSSMARPCTVATQSLPSGARAMLGVPMLHCVEVMPSAWPNHRWDFPCCVWSTLLTCLRQIPRQV
jgi:hypothetical protein